MILVNDNWVQIHDLQDVSKIIREYYNRDLADELDELIPEHTDEEYEELQWDYDQKCDKVTDLENEVDDLEGVIDNIESNVNEIMGMLENIKGLSEIEEIKEKVDKLCDKLY